MFTSRQVPTVALTRLALLRAHPQPSAWGAGRTTPRAAEPGPTGARPAHATRGKRLAFPRLRPAYSGSGPQTGSMTVGSTVVHESPTGLGVPPIMVQRAVSMFSQVPFDLQHPVARRTTPDGLWMRGAPAITIGASSKLAFDQSIWACESSPPGATSGESALAGPSTSNPSTNVKIRIGDFIMTTSFLWPFPRAQYSILHAEIQMG